MQARREERLLAQGLGAGIGGEAGGGQDDRKSDRTSQPCRQSGEQEATPDSLVHKRFSLTVGSKLGLCQSPGSAPQASQENAERQEAEHTTQPSDATPNGRGELAAIHREWQDDEKRARVKEEKPGKHRQASGIGCRRLGD